MKWTECWTSHEIKSKAKKIVTIARSHSLYSLLLSPVNAQTGMAADEYSSFRSSTAEQATAIRSAMNMKGKSIE
jgi:hypothetical protein